MIHAAAFIVGAGIGAPCLLSPALTSQDRALIYAHMFTSGLAVLALVIMAGSWS